MSVYSILGPVLRTQLNPRHRSTRLITRINLFLTVWIKSLSTLRSFLTLLWFTSFYFLFFSFQQVDFRTFLLADSSIPPSRNFFFIVSESICKLWVILLSREVTLMLFNTSHGEILLPAERDSYRAQGRCHCLPVWEPWNFRWHTCPSSCLGLHCICDGFWEQGGFVTGHWLCWLYFHALGQTLPAQI